jgi:hypothetical protein
MAIWSNVLHSYMFAGASSSSPRGADVCQAAGGSESSRIDPSELRLLFRAQSSAALEGPTHRVAEMAI